MLTALFGPVMVLIFCLSQALRDVYFAKVFQGVDMFVVIIVAFGLSTLLFGVLTAMRSPADFATMRRQGATVLAMNLTTALAWPCYFFGLKHLEPAIVLTVHSGMAPLTMIGLGACGMTLAQPGQVSRREYACYAGIALSLAGLWWVVLSGRSGLTHASTASSLLGLTLLLASGASITVSLLYSKRLHDHGVHAEAVMAVRYVLLIGLAAGIEVYMGGPEGIGTFGQLSSIALAASALIVFPSFMLQIGIAHTAPLTAQVIRALGPVCVFALQQYDGRLVYAAPTLTGILAYSVCVIASNVVHGWRDAPPATLAHAGSGSGQRY